MLKSEKFFSKDEVFDLLNSDVGNTVMTLRGIAEVLESKIIFSSIGEIRTAFIQLSDGREVTIVELVDTATYERPMWPRKPKHKTHVVKQSKVENYEPSEVAKTGDVTFVTLING